VVTGLLRIKTSYQAGSGRKTLGGIVGVGKPKAVKCQPIKMRGSDLTPIRTQIRKTHVVNQDKDDIGWVFQTGVFFKTT
jgi:hypothetical protein